jgi:flavin-binding protein dodecin
MHFTEEQLVQILLAALAILGYLAKRWADARLVKVKKEAEAQIHKHEIAEEAAKVHAKQMEHEAEIRKAEADQGAKLIDIIGTSLDKMSAAMKESAATQSKTVDKLIERLEKKDEQIGEDQAYVNEHLQRATETSKKAAELAESAVKEVGRILTEATELHRQTREFMTEQVQRAVEMSQHFINAQELYKAFRVAFDFPPDDDCRWLDGLLSPRSAAEIRLWASPAHINQPVIGTISADGQEGHIIFNTLFKDWVAIRVGDLRGWTLTNHVLFRPKQPA